MRFLREATDLPESDYVRDKADHEKPRTAFHREYQTPADYYSDYQIGDNSPRQFHPVIIPERISAASSEPIIPDAVPGA